MGSLASFLVVNPLVNFRMIATLGEGYVTGHQLPLFHFFEFSSKFHFHLSLTSVIAALLRVCDTHSLLFSSLTLVNFRMIATLGGGYVTGHFLCFTFLNF